MDMEEKKLVEQLKKAVKELQVRVSWLETNLEMLEGLKLKIEQPTPESLKPTYKGKYPDAPATRFQKDYLEFLKVPFTTSITRAQASDLIKKAKEAQE